jgi:hypothetical protein
MVIEILSFKQSILNPLLKWIVLVLFIIAVYLFYRCRLIYGGKLRLVATLLLLGGVAAILSSAFRIAGDFFIQWKWGESSLGLLVAMTTLAIAIIVRLKFRRASTLFGDKQGEEQK